MSQNVTVANLIEIINDKKLKEFLIHNSKNFENAVLQFASETDENLNCVSQIEYGTVTNLQYGFKSKSGFKLKNQNLLISDILNTLENIEIPDEIKNEFPELSIEEWDAITRLITIVFLAFERDFN